MELKVPFVDLKAQYRSIRQEIAGAMDEVLESAQYTGGPVIERFEQAFAAAVGARYCIAVNSGTDALELALRAAGIGAGDEVIVPANSFFATAEAVSLAGAQPVFADVDESTFHLSAESAAAAVTPRTKAIIPVHLYGRAMDLKAIEQLAAQHHLLIIEDAAQAHLVGIGGKMVGAAGRMTCFSFYPGKNLGAYGEAGAITTSDAKQVEMLHMLRDHGSPAKYRHDVVGRNARMDALQAAVLSVKLRHLPAWNAARYQHAKAYASNLAQSSLVLPVVPEEGEHNFHLYVVRSKQREQLRQWLTERCIGCGIHYPVPLHLTEAYQRLGAPRKGSLPVAERLAGEILSLPMFPELKSQQIDQVADVIATVAQLKPRTVGV